ncbi:MAG: hypothetical protein ABIJ43_05840 [Candidatus Beckwithbacteria bacterium]|uniref:Uncharacterized protein n=1 Tax=viral metagenome TaxID=1070528 RepID=A0A6M3JW99_9ZZZZ
MKYHIKTRNWHCKLWVKKLLDISLLFGAGRGDNYNDGDGKYGFDTDSLVSGLLMLGYYKLLSHWSGGWTYIMNTGKFFRKAGITEYNTFYL